MNHISRALQIAGRGTFAAGGPPLAPAPPPGANIANNVAGPLNGASPGRTDTLPISVPEGAYIVPADVVSFIGQGNTNAGMKMLAQRFGAAPSQPGQQGKPIDIMAAAGEFVVSPQAVAALGNGDVKSGHAVLDAWVKAERKDHQKTLADLPAPVGAKK